MSQENVERVRFAFQKFSAADEAGADVAPLVERYFAPDAIYETARDAPDAGTYRGREAILRLFRDWRETFDDFSVELGRFAGEGETVASEQTISGRLKGSAPDSQTVTFGFAVLCTVRDGVIAAAREYDHFDEALAAAGLQGS